MPKIINKIIALLLCIWYYTNGDFMRLRKLRNFEKRHDRVEAMRIPCRIPDFDLSGSDNYYEPIDFRSVFGRSNPLVLEIGCGKGQFAVEYAKRNPDKNIVGVECAPGVLVKACEKALNENVENIRFLELKAEYLPIFIEKNSVCEIYLNFSTPFPKARHEKHRLTSKEFLAIYKKLMTPDAFIAQKTDNEAFFDFSVESFIQNGFELSEVTRDLHNSGFEGNIVTEYEERFSSMGMPIYRLVARLKK